MRLKSIKDTPPGGWRFEILLKDQPSLVVVENEGGYKSLIKKVKHIMINNSIPLPATLEEEVQDYLCQQLPSDKCFYSSGLGDQISRMIHTAAKIVDYTLGTKVEKRVRGCKNCGNRRVKLNN